MFISQSITWKVALKTTLVAAVISFVIQPPLSLREKLFLGFQPCCTNQWNFAWLPFEVPNMFSGQISQILRLFILKTDYASKLSVYELKQNGE
jgi:hypothetical protein